MNEEHSLEDRRAEEERQLSELLAAMPREKASKGFTAQVLARIVAAPAQGTTSPTRATVSESKGLRWPLAPLLAAAAILCISLGFGGRELWHRHEREEAVARYETLRAEHEALEAELHRLRLLAVEARPVVYLGGDENVEYVVDLSAPQRRREGIYPAVENPFQEAPNQGSSGRATGHEITTEMNNLSPFQLRQHPRRIY